MSGATIEAAGIKEILESLPHRYPFLMVDRVVSMRGDEFAIGIKNVTFNEPQFMGHFPGQPVFPGVLMIEGMAQTAGVMCIASGIAGKAKAVYFMTIDKAKFRKPVGPGDVIEYHGESFGGILIVDKLRVISISYDEKVENPRPSNQRHGTPPASHSIPTRHD